MRSERSGAAPRDTKPSWHQTARSLGVSPAMVSPVLLFSPLCAVPTVVSMTYYQQGAETALKLKDLDAETAMYEQERAQLRARLLDVQAATTRALVAAQRCQSDAPGP